MAGFEDEIMMMISEHLEDRIEPLRRRQLEKALAENPEVRAAYRDMVALRAGLKKLFSQQTNSNQTSADVKTADQDINCKS